MKQTNLLINSTSPYLLQHAHNPVNWYPWSAEAFEKAVTEDKLVLVSIGYSACHWCHVMEHESFEDESVAEVMNNFFVCIKVDREERPDIDQVYMSAVQLMTGRGGWPLNCFVLPDGRPVYGGTYFPREQWINVLKQLALMFRQDRGKMMEYASQLTAGVNQQEGLPVAGAFNENEGSVILNSTVEKWKPLLDPAEGGPARAPKFPLPNNYIFLLAYGFLHKDEELLAHIRLTLQKMAKGGIYDQLGGGFARYSVDDIWKVPHFEKMLYDNAQLISLYSLAFKYNPDPLYREVVMDTLQFIKIELTGLKGNFLSALDADSEGEEGRFYVWKREEILEHLGSDAALFMDYFNVNEKGLWEHENYILLRDRELNEIAKKHGISLADASSNIKNSKIKLNQIRDQRIKPGLDDKTLASWNGLMITGYLDAFDAFGDPDYLKSAMNNADFILKNMMRDDGGLWHTWKAVPAVNGYLEDHAFVIQAFIHLYQCTFDRSWLDRSKELCHYVLDHFSDDGSPYFYFTSDVDPPLYTRKYEMQDNVIPASNSQMALNLYILGRYFERKDWMLRSQKMWNGIAADAPRYGSAYSNWLLLGLYFSEPESELVICGQEAISEQRIFAKRYAPLLLIAGCLKEDGLPLTKGRVPEHGTAVYLCQDKTCGLPVATVTEALVSTRF